MERPLPQPPLMFINYDVVERAKRKFAFVVKPALSVLAANHKVATADMKRMRPLLWGVLSGCILGSAMFLLGINLDHPWVGDEPVNPALVIWSVLHWPTRAMLNRSHTVYQAVVIIVGYWITIGVAAGILMWLFRTWRARRRDQT
jgi:hypothetical protein